MCGSCPRVIRIGDPMLEIRFAFLQGPEITKQRCASCAGEDVPELPPLERKVNVIQPTPKASAARRQQLLAAVGELARDWKHAQAGEREPGEDDE